MQGCSLVGRRWGTHCFNTSIIPDRPHASGSSRLHSDDKEGTSWPTDRARAAATTDGAGMHDHGPSTRDADSGPGSVAQGPPSDPARVACAPLMQHETATRWPSSTPRVHATASVRREPSPSSEATPTHTRADPRRRTTSMLHQAQTAARPTAHLCAVARCSETM